MGKAQFLLVLLAACGSAGIYQNDDGWIFSETALLSAPDSRADTLDVFLPGTQVTLFGRPSRNSTTLNWCKVTAPSDPGTAGFVRIIDLALTSKFDSASQTVLMYGFSDSGGQTDISGELRIARDGRIVNSTPLSSNTVDVPEDWDYNYRGCFIQRDESGYENASSVFILHLPTRNSDLCNEKLMLVLTGDSTIIPGLCISDGLIQEHYNSAAYFITPEETSVDNIVTAMLIISENITESDESPERLFWLLRSVWDGSRFEATDEPCILTLPAGNASYLTEADLQPFLHPFEFRIHGFQILNYPDALLPPGAEELEIIPVSFSSEPSDFTHLIIAFAYPGGWLPLDTLLSPGDINTAKLYGKWMEDTATLELYTYGTMSSSYPIHTWNRDCSWKFNLISAEVRDAAAASYAAMDSLLAGGNIQEAYGWLNYILMAKMGERAHAEMAVQFFMSAVSACPRGGNGLEPLEQANRAFALMGMRDWFIEIPSMGRDTYLESQFAPYLNTGNLLDGLHYLREVAEHHGDSLSAAEFENALNFSE
ncbi:MAG: hypothetical protein K8S62_04570 [Candidatus Sabulitectum sp.]|nr:hypothetical protein [Candidatus Sabulitectum sp.]